MTTREILVHVCDLCGAEADANAGEVPTHTIAVDGRRVDVEVCDLCWGRVELTLGELLEGGRTSTRRRARRSRR